MLNQDQKIQMHEDICKTLHQLYIDKNNDYGDSVSDTFKKFGIESFLVRMYDKLNRLYSLSRPNKEHRIEDEKYTDTLADLANYAILAMIELNSEKSDFYETNGKHFFDNLPSCNIDKFCKSIDYTNNYKEIENDKDN